MIDVEIELFFQFINYHFTCIASILLLLATKKYLAVPIYLLGSTISFKIGLALKGYIQEPRPEEDEQNINQLEKYMRKKTPHEKYGMPSSSGISVGFSFMFIYLLFQQNNNVLLFFMLVSLNRIHNRIRHHSYIQMFVGLIIGLFLGNVYYKLSQTFCKIFKIIL
jgi:hypothetical protein